uniref:Small ribosomal subunit protein uS10m n=1 Tax=Eptatretus burgeri TaxID=7764 RepID=A0A8C4NL18_EPTBU
MPLYTAKINEHSVGPVRGHVLKRNSRFCFILFILHIINYICVSISPPPPKFTVTNEPDDLFRRLIVRVKGHDTAVLDSYEFFVSLAARELEITLEKIWEPKKVFERLTLLKSVHIYKKHRVQYEMRTYGRVFEVGHIHLKNSRLSQEESMYECINSEDLTEEAKAFRVPPPQPSPLQ